MLNALIAGVMAASVALVSALWLIHRAPSWAPHDAPGGRKQHQAPTPLIGGVIIFLGLLPLLVIDPASTAIAPFVLLMNITVLIGLVDDRKGLSAGLRLAAHSLVGLAMALWAGVSLSSLGSLLGEEPIHLGWMAIPLTCFAVAASMNSINMTDGVDGLAGALCLLPITAVFFFARDAQVLELMLQSAAVLGGLMVFLLFNFPFPWRVRASCFLGDTGSTLLGLAVAWFLIHAAQLGLFRPVFALFLLAVPLIDMAGVMLRRVLRKVSMSQAGRDHLHHVLIDSGMNQRHATQLIVGVAMLLAALGLLMELRAVPEWLMFSVFSVLLLANLLLLRSAEQAKLVIRQRWFS